MTTSCASPRRATPPAQPVDDGDQLDHEGSPYLWWTGPDDAAILQATVAWGLSSGRLGPSVKVGVIAGDRASDQLALNQYLLPDLSGPASRPS